MSAIHPFTNQGDAGFVDDGGADERHAKIRHRAVHTLVHAEHPAAIQQTARLKDLKAELETTERAHRSGLRVVAVSAIHREVAHRTFFDGLTFVAESRIRAVAARATDVAIEWVQTRLGLRGPSGGTNA